MPSSNRNHTHNSKEIQNINVLIDFKQKTWEAIAGAGAGAGAVVGGGG